MWCGHHVCASVCALPCVNLLLLCKVRYTCTLPVPQLELLCFFIINSEEHNEETAVGHLHPIPHTDMLILLSTMKRALLHGIIFLFHLSHVYTLCVYSSDCFIKMGLHIVFHYRPLFLLGSFHYACTYQTFDNCLHITRRESVRGCVNVCNMQLLPSMPTSLHCFPRSSVFLSDSLIERLHVHYYASFDSAGFGISFARKTMSGNNEKSSLLKAQNDVNEVVGIMRDNVEKVLERDAKIGDLEDKSEELMHGSKQFQRSAKTLKNKMWCQNKMWCIGIFVVSAHKVWNRTLAS